MITVSEIYTPYHDTSVCWSHPGPDAFFVELGQVDGHALWSRPSNLCPCPLATWNLFYAFAPRRIERIGERNVIHAAASSFDFWHDAAVLSCEPIAGFDSVAAMMDAMEPADAVRLAASMFSTDRNALRQFVSRAVARVQLTNRRRARVN